MNKELYIQRERNAKGHLLPGTIPHNKGKKWDEWQTLDGRKRRKILNRLKLGRKKGNPDLPGANRKTIIAVKDGRIVGVFESAKQAANKITAGNFSEKSVRRNINHCCNKKRKKCMGLMWFFEKDDDILNYVKRS